jgi:hypothetical protein
MHFHSFPLINFILAFWLFLTEQWINFTINPIEFPVYQNGTNVAVSVRDIPCNPDAVSRVTPNENAAGSFVQPWYPRTLEIQRTRTGEMAHQMAWSIQAELHGRWFEGLVLRY